MEIGIWNHSAKLQLISSHIKYLNKNCIKNMFLSWEKKYQQNLNNLISIES